MVSRGETAPFDLGPTVSASQTPVVVSLCPESAPMCVLNKTARIGRAGGCEIVLADCAVSRIHAQLIPSSVGVDVTDLYSLNGTYVNGRRVRQTTLAPLPSILRIGGTILLITTFEAAFEPAWPAAPLVGGAALAAIRRQAALVAPTSLPILLFGEAGTGKEVVGRMVHDASGRSGRFVAVDCAKVPAAVDRPLELAHRGTLFLDNVWKLPLEAQETLLGVLEDGSALVDVRLIAATNRDMSRDIDVGRFRADLYGRLSAVEMRLPALRERIEDLPALARFLSARAGGAPPAFDVDALEAMAFYAWPGNVRELDSALQHARFPGAPRITLDLLPLRIRDAFAFARGTSDTLQLVPSVTELA